MQPGPWSVNYLRSRLTDVDERGDGGETRPAAAGEELRPIVPGAWAVWARSGSPRAANDERRVAPARTPGRSNHPAPQAPRG
jgi:hypothetical protein